MKKQFLLFVVMMAINMAVSAQADAVGATSGQPNLKFLDDSVQTKQTVGMAIDLLPPIMSASTGHLGYSGQLWYGYKKFRVRGIIAGFQMPDKLMGNDDFKDLKVTATAVIFDCFKNYNFKGWWLGGGFELWNNSIIAKTDARNYSFTDCVATAGSGYIFKVYKNFYVEPWGAVHCVLNGEKITVGAAEYKTKRFQGEVSLKIGWHF